MSKIRFFASLMIASILGGVVALTAYHYMIPQTSYQSIEQKQQVHFANFLPDSNIIVPEGINFIQASAMVRSSVVHIKVSYANQAHWRSDESFEDMFRPFHGDHYGRSLPKQSSGSGVIISGDGYIATNHHVIDDAAQIEVVLYDKRSYKAKLIGSDPTTDLALLKISENNLPFLRYGDSDRLQIGEWVLAVGNPFDLTSTVTAGIVSAKGRNINLLKDTYAIESFIQTDAAVNPGNSGGALVNLRGELVGVNTAIATHTGYYSGYSFAVPITIVKKVMDDLMNYGEIQRALLGVTIDEVDAKMAEEKKLETVLGVCILSLKENGAAQLAGLRKGDVIEAVDGIGVNSASELQTAIAVRRPGDQVEIIYWRQGRKSIARATLRNKLGTYEVVRKKISPHTQVLGAELGNIDEREKRRLGIPNGVKVLKLGRGSIKASGMREGFIITKVDDKVVQSPEDVRRVVQTTRRTLAVEGVYPNGDKSYYAIGR